MVPPVEALVTSRFRGPGTTTATPRGSHRLASLSRARRVSTDAGFGRHGDAAAHARGRRPAGVRGAAGESQEEATASLPRRPPARGLARLRAAPQVVDRGVDRARGGRRHGWIESTPIATDGNRGRLRRGHAPDEPWRDVEALDFRVGAALPGARPGARAVATFRLLARRRGVRGGDPRHPVVDGPRLESRAVSVEERGGGEAGGSPPTGGVGARGTSQAPEKIARHRGETLGNRQRPGGPHRRGHESGVAGDVRRG